MRVRDRAGEQVESESCSDKETAKAGWGERRERFLAPCDSFCREFFSLPPLTAILVPDAFHALPLRKPLRLLEYLPSLECVHSTEARSNRWPFLAPTPTTCPYKYLYLPSATATVTEGKYLYLPSVTVAVAYPFAFTLSS